MSYIISNKNALKNKIHEIHNYMRNSGAGYGKNALKIFNILYGLMKIEENNLLEKTGLPFFCSFKYLLLIANDKSDNLNSEKLSDLIFGDVLNAIHKNTKLRNFLFYEIPKNIKSEIFVYLLNEISKLPEIEKACNVQLAGKIYEYFIGRDEKAISELGAHYTDRHIVQFILNEIDIDIKNGKIPKMIDMFGGSGGFTAGYISFLKKYTNINWREEIEKIYHYDIDDDVIKSAALEVFCLTGEYPNELKFTCKNAFKCEYNSEMFELLLTNPPYGGDKLENKEAKEERNIVEETIIKMLKMNIEDKNLENNLKIQLQELQIIEELEKDNFEKMKVCVESSSGYIQRYCKLNNLKGNDKETVSLILIMSLLAPNGTAVGVLKEGLFFNKKYKDIRKFLIENFNIIKIISVPNDQFENTTTKTQIIIFKNTLEKTSKIDFYDLKVNKYEDNKFDFINGRLILSEKKGSIFDVSKILVATCTIDEIKKTDDWSLNNKQYSMKDIIPNKNYKNIKLIELCDIEYGTRITKETSELGNYPVYGGGDVSFYNNSFNRNENTLILSRFGISKTCVRLINEKFYLNDGGMSVKARNINLQNYINCLLLSDKLQNYIYEKLTNGTIQKGINMTLLKEFKIPIPEDEKKIIEWNDKIIKIQNNKKEFANLSNELANEVIFQI